MKHCLFSLRRPLCPRSLTRALSLTPPHEILRTDQELLRTYARKKQHSVSLKNLVETGSGFKLNEFKRFQTPAFESAANYQKVCIQIACFLHREVPIRIAHRVVELEGFYYFHKSPSIQSVCRWYKESFSELIKVPAPIDVEKEAAFASTLKRIYERHSGTLIMMAKGAKEIREQLKESVDSFADRQDVQERLDQFYLSRIGIRMLIGQYLALRENSSERGMIGLISPHCSPAEIAQQVIDDATYICQRTHGDAPEVTIHGRTDLTFPYVPSHLSYMLLELLKNSMRATIETHGVDKMPPIRIVIADGEDNEDVAIKVSDEGGGIRRSNMRKIWSYLFTTADHSILENMLASDDVVVPDFDRNTPLAGLGYGLPISRNYARYFGGELTVMSMEGYGTDGFIYLPRLGEKTPVRE